MATDSTLLNSDAVNQGSRQHGAYYETGPIELDASEVNADLQWLDWDFGLWRPTDYGDAYIDGLEYRYPVTTTNTISPELAGRHIISTTIFMGAGVDAELDGRPDINAWGDDSTASPDDEDGVVFKSYMGTLEKPSAIMQQGGQPTRSTSASRCRRGQRAISTHGSTGMAMACGTPVNKSTNTSRVGSGTIPLTFNVPDTATLGTTYARFRFSTQPGLQPTGTAIDGEVEDYQIQIVAKPVKSIVATSEISTTGSNLAIGEIVRYRLAVEIPKGVLTNFTITDNLPAGMKFLNDDTAKLALIGTIPITPSDAALESAQITGNAVTTPTFVIPTANITPTTFGDGTKPVFKLGTLTNTNDISTTQYVVVEFNALVLNVVGNQSGGTRDNTFGVSYNNVARTSDSVRLPWSSRTCASTSPWCLRQRQPSARALQSRTRSQSPTHHPAQRMPSTWS